MTEAERIERRRARARFLYLIRRQRERSAEQPVWVTKMTVRTWFGDFPLGGHPHEVS